MTTDSMKANDEDLIIGITRYLCYRCANWFDIAKEKCYINQEIGAIICGKCIDEILKAHNEPCDKDITEK